MRFLKLFAATLMFCVLAQDSGRVLAQQTEGSILFVAPHRLIIEPNENVDIISVSNKSDKPRRYDLSMVDQVMGEDGVTQRKDTFDYSIKRMTKFVPKRFTLQPGEGQTVRVQVTRPADLADGDYHSHLLFREVPLSVKDKQQLQKEREEASKTLSFEIRTLYGIAVPVVVQKGKLEADISMEAPVLQKTEDGRRYQIAMTFNRIGNSEAAGKFSGEYVREGKPAAPVVEAQWIRLYREVEKVKKNFVLSGLPEDADGGKIVVYMMKDENDESKTVKMEIPFRKL
jgi:hypothetical protein